MENKVVLGNNVNKRKFLASIEYQLANTKTNLRIGNGLSQREALSIVKRAQKDKKIQVSDEALIEFAKVLQKEVNTKVGNIKQSFNSNTGIVEKPTCLKFDEKAILEVNLGYNETKNS